jgi:polyferredoxin
MLTALALRSFTGISVIHDRNPLYVTLADGSIRNGYTIRILNKRPIERTFTVSAHGLDGARLEIAEGAGAEKNVVTVASDTTDELRVLFFAPAGAKLDKSTAIRFRIDDVASHESAGADDYFKAP